MHKTHEPSYTPTPEQIRRECARIRGVDWATYERRYAGWKGERNLPTPRPEISQTKRDIDHADDWQYLGPGKWLKSQGETNDAV